MAARGFRLSDASFAQAICGDEIEECGRIVVIIRNLIAEHCGVDSDTIFPDDDMVYLSNLMGSNGFFGWLFDIHYGQFDTLGFVLALEAALDRQLGIKVSDKLSRIMLENANPANGNESSSISIHIWSYKLAKSIIAQLAT